MRVALLGPLTVEHDGQPVIIGGQRLRTLFIRLAVEPGQWIGAAKLVDALWDDEPPADPLNALQSLVSRLRRLLPSPGLIESSPAAYRLAVDAQAVDTARFEMSASAGRQALASGDAQAAASALEEAHRLWRGPALADVDGANFTSPYVSHLEQLRRVAEEDRYEAALQLGRYAEVIPELEAIVAAEPLRERAAAQLIRALQAAGRQADALSAFDRTRSVLVEELGLDPSPELSAAHQAVLVGSPAPPTAAASPRTNLPTALTSFVGREDEMDRVAELLGSNRLVTLTGPGGAGKTRLAVAAGHHMTSVPGGVWMVELAPVSDSDELPAAVLGTLSAREINLLDPSSPTARDVLGRLTDLLSGRNVLLLLDNCEHLIEAAARLADHLLTHCPQLRILATSREPLAIFGETICPVLPLGMPDTNISAADALGFASVRLFADRAAAVRPGFVVDDDTLPAVVEICRRLDGLPLAIELAAARLRTLPVGVVAARLIDRFRLLTGGSRTAVARHQTLRSVVAWSWELLTDVERRLAESLAVFHGGVTVESAMAVSAASYDDTLELLTALADKSILQPAPNATLRWRMLETLREYGAEQLSIQGRTDAVRTAHAAFFCQLAETAEPQLRSPAQQEYLRILGAERDNLSAALRFTVDNRDAETAVRLGAALTWYWHLIGGEADAAAWLNQILPLPGAVQQPGFAVCVVGWAFSVIGSGDRSTHAARAAELAADVSAVDVADGHPLLLLLEPGLAMLHGEPDVAQQSIDRQLSHPDPWARSALQLVRALVAENVGDLTALRAASGAALAGFREAGDRWGIAMSLAIGAGVAVVDGELPTAVGQYAEAVELLQELGSPDDVAFLLIRSALALERSGDRVGAANALARARALAEERGSASMLAMTEFALGQQLHADGDGVAGRAFILEAIQRAELAPNVAPQALASMYCAVSGIETALGWFPAAYEHIAHGWRLARDSYDMPVVALCGLKVAKLAAAQGDPALAARLLGASDSVRGAPDRSDPEAAELIAQTRAAIGETAATELETGRSLARDAALQLLEAHLQAPSVTSS